MTDRPTVLLPLRVLERESIPEGIPELLAEAHVILLGYHVIPEQTAPGQARQEFGERADRQLTALAEALSAAGATVETRLVFTHEAQTTIDRVIGETDSHAVLVPNALGDLDRVLVAVRGTVGIHRLVRLVAGLFAAAETALTLFHVAPDAESDADAETLLEGVTDRLVDAGIDPARLDARVSRDSDPADAIAAVAQDFDVVVMGETDPTVVTYFFGMPADQVAEQFLGPVLVVQREPRSDSEADSPSSTP